LLQAITRYVQRSAPVVLRNEMQIMHKIVITDVITGSDMHRATMEDLLKACLDPSNKLPTFFAIDLCRLPPVDIEHCDVTAILKELQALRAEVRELVNLRQEVKMLKSTNDDLLRISQEIDSLKVARAEFVTKADLKLLKEELTRDPRQQLHQQRMLPNENEWPILQSLATTSVDERGVLPAAGPCIPTSFASHARDLQKTGMQKAKSTNNKHVVGKSTNHCKIMSVDTRRSVDLFVSRFDPHTATGEVIECVSDILNGHPTEQITCTRLKSRVESLYASFYVAVSVSASSMKQALEILMSSESWPLGLLVRRYFKPKNELDVK
jgi:hypothetical protein